jgi:hypothetical protein
MRTLRVSAMFDKHDPLPGVVYGLQQFAPPASFRQTASGGCRGARFSEQRRGHAIGDRSQSSARPSSP